MIVSCVYKQASQSTRDNGYANEMLTSQGLPASLTRSEQVSGGLMLMEEEKRTSPQRLPPEVGELTLRLRVRP